MTKLRFKIWDSLLKQFLFGGRGVEIQDCHYVGEVEYLQYTGLNDKDGREIYEGDIVKATWRENQPYGYNPSEWDIQEKVFTVIWKAPSFVFPRIGDSQTATEDYQLTVIGNIYENRSNNIR